MVKLGCKLFAVSLHRYPGQGESAALVSAVEMNHFTFFQKEAMSQFLGQLTTRVAATAIVGTRTSTEREEFGEVYIAHCYAACAELCCVVVGDRNYPYRVAFDIAAHAIERFLQLYTPLEITGDPRDTPFPELQRILERYQKPEQADSLLKMRRDIVETTQTLHGNMNKMLERGDKVENLVRKSEVLKSSADMFKRIVKKRAPTPPKGASDKIKTSFALTAIALILVAVTVGTNQLITVKVYPQNSADYPTPIDNIATVFGMSRTCYLFSLVDDGGIEEYCTMSRALGGDSGCESPDTQSTSGTDASLLGLITSGMFFLALLIAGGFSVCVFRRPDDSKQFAMIALVLTILATISLGIASYTWANAFSNSFFTSPQNWCVIDGQLGPMLANVTRTCRNGAAEDACRTEVNWGYSSFILWLALGCTVGVLVCQVGESWSVMTTSQVDAEEAFANKKYDVPRQSILGDDETTPLLINEGDGPGDINGSQSAPPAPDDDAALL